MTQIDNEMANDHTAAPISGAVLDSSEQWRVTPTVRVFLAYVVFALVFGVGVPWWVCGRCDISYHPQDFYPMQKPGGDFVVTYVAAQSLLSGRPIYDYFPDSPDWSAPGPGNISRYAYAPPQAYLMLPLGLPSFERSHGVWIGLTIALIILSAWMASRMFDSPWFVFLAACAIYAQSSFIHFQFERGQTDALPLICIVLSLYFHTQRRNSYLAGLFCAMGAVIKVLPAVLLLYFLLRLDWRAILSTVVSAAAIVLATGLGDWERWYTEIIPAWSPIHIGFGQNVDHSLVYLIGSFTGNVDLALLISRIAAAVLLGAYAVLVLVNRERKRHVLIEMAILTMIVEIVTPWSINYKLVVLLFVFVSPFAILTIDAVRKRPISYTLPLFAAFVLIVPMFGEYWMRLPFSILAGIVPGDMLVSNPIDPILTDRKVALGAFFTLAYLVVLYGRAAVATRPLLQAKVRRVVAAVLGKRSPGRVAVALLLVAVFSGCAVASARVLAPSDQFRQAVERFGEARPINDWASLAGIDVEPTAGGGWTIDLIYRSHGPMPRNLQIYLHADMMDENEPQAREGRNFFPSLITTHWPAGKFVVARTTTHWPPGEYRLEIGFFDLDDGRRYGQVELDNVSFKEDE